MIEKENRIVKNNYNSYKKMIKFGKRILKDIH